MDPKKIEAKSEGEAKNGGEEHKVNVGDEVHILSMHDVLCGRGSGPNDHPGNINFRKLILSRKAEYLSTTARAEKARIAQEIVEVVQNDHDPPGRFLKKMGPAELGEKGYDKGEDVWVVVDQDTALEKAKQALRQNRDKPLIENQLRQKQAEKAAGGSSRPQQQQNASLNSNSADSAAKSSVTSSVASSTAEGQGGRGRHHRSSSSKSAEGSIHSAASYTSAASGGPSAPGSLSVGVSSPVDGHGEGAAVQYPSGPAVQYPGGHPAYIQPGIHPAAAFSGHAPAMPPSVHPEDMAQPPMHYGHYAYHPQYGQPPPPPPPPPPQGVSPGVNDDLRQSLRVTDLTHELHRMGPFPAGSGDEKGSPVNQEQFPYAFGEPSHDSSNITMGSVFSGVSESELLAAANLDPIPVPTGSNPVIDEANVPGPMSSGTINMVQQLVQASDSENGQEGEDDQQVNRQEAYQQQQVQRHPGHYESYTQQYYYRNMPQQKQQSMRGLLRSSVRGGLGSTRSDMSLSMSLSELTRDPSGRNVTGYRSPSVAAATGGGMQGIAEGGAGDEEEDGGQSPQPMSGSSGKISGKSSGEMSGLSIGSGRMAASVASEDGGDKPALAVAPRPIDLIQEEPDSLNFMGASSASMMKAVLEGSSSSFSQMSISSITKKKTEIEGNPPT